MSSTKRKAPPVRIARPQTTQNAKHASKAQINESRTSVVSVPKHQLAAKKEALGDAIEISSDEDESDNDAKDDGEDLMDEDEPATADAHTGAVALDSSNLPLANGHAHRPVNDDDDDDDDAGDHEPTFGDLVREHETVDVTAALNLLSPADNAANDQSALPATAGKALTTSASAAAVPTLASLGHLLNAALRSGDDANLEICFNTTTDATWVRNTIQRLDPSLAGTLLQKLAARIHRRPGRAHTLVGWVQWTLITHGGALLANQTGVTRALQELHRVLEERARGLNSLLLLKGKLDMLEAQMQMRRLQRAGVATFGTRGGSKAVDSVNNLGRAADGPRGGVGRPRRGSAAASGASATDYDEDNVVTYNEELEDEDEGDVSGQILVSSANVAGESFVANSDDEVLDEEDEEDSSEDDDNDNGAEDDDELEEMDDDETGDEDEVDYDDVDDEEDDDEDDDDEQAAPPPPKLQKKAGAPFSKRR
ncbi:MAG: Small subunit (SSU) processome component [Sporothrix epigloea]